MLEAGSKVDDIYAVHGGPIESVIKLSRSGTFLTRGVFGREFHFVKVGQSIGMRDHFSDAVTVASDYANWNALQYWLLEVLKKSFKFKPGNLPDFKHIIYKDDEVVIGDFFRQAKPYGITESKFYQLVRIGEQRRKGALFFLSKKIAQDFKIGETGISDEGKIISPKSGLSINYVTGIEPLGEYERDVLEEMKKSISRNEV